MIKTRSELQKVGQFQLSEETKSANDEQRQLNESYQGYISLIERYNKISGKEQQLTFNRQIQSLQELVILLDENSNKLKSLDLPQAKIIGQRLDLLTKSLKSFNSSISVDKFRDIITAITELEQGEGFDLETVEKRRIAALELERKFVAEYVASRIQGSKNTGEALMVERAEYEKTGQLLFSTLKQASTDIDVYTKSVEDAIMQLQKLRDESQKLANDPQTLSGWAQKNREQLTNALTVDLGTLEQNRKDIKDLEEILLTGRFDQAQKFAQEIEFIEYNLLQQGIDIRAVSYEEKLALLKAFLNQELSEEELANKKRQDDRNKEIDSYANAIREFQGILNSIQQTLNDYYNFEFDKLESRNKQLQAQIVGDTALANQKRIDIEKQYQAEKLRLEKKAAKASLTISLLQASANVAESITAALRSGIPVVSQIAAGVNAAIGAIQVGIIANQLARIDSFQRGGVIKMRKAQGGTVVGPSHEYGGVRFGQRGLELEGGESVINRMSSLKYGDLLSEINMAGGGRPLVNNNFDDSRLLEALAKQRSEPIRAYVVESDITNKQTIARRLDQLSQV